MSYNQKELKLDVNNKPVPQLYNPGIDDFEALQGRGGASAIVAGRFWQVGAGATTTSIPMMTSSGLAVALSTTNQSRLIGSTLEIVIGTTMCEANVTAVSTSGTLTLDSPLPQAPAQGTSFLLIPPNPTQLTGSNTTNVTLANAVTATGVQTAVSVGNNKTLRVEVDGTATSFAVTIQGIGESGAAYALTATNYTGLTTTQSITSAGLYQFDVTGLVAVEANVTAVSGGNVNVTGKLVAS